MSRSYFYESRNKSLEAFEYKGILKNEHGYRIAPEWMETAINVGIAEEKEDGTLVIKKVHDVGKEEKAKIGDYIIKRNIEIRGLAYSLLSVMDKLTFESLYKPVVE